jgi:hypothetical protein
MSVRVWQSVKYCFCEHAGEQVALEADLVYPADWMPESPPRVLGHRCSHGLDCNLDSRPSCVWAGTNPLVDPFREWMAKV